MSGDAAEPRIRQRADLAWPPHTCEELMRSMEQWRNGDWQMEAENLTEKPSPELHSTL